MTGEAQGLLARAKAELAANGISLAFHLGLVDVRELQGARNRAKD